MLLGLTLKHVEHLFFPHYGAHKQGVIFPVGARVFPTGNVENRAGNLINKACINFKQRSNKVRNRGNCLNETQKDIPVTGNGK